MRCLAQLVLLGALVWPLCGVTGVARTLVIAHRGLSSQAPENTIAAFLAARLWADLVEMDVQVTADGQLVIMHDDTVDRTTNGVGAVRLLTAEQIRALDAGAKFGPQYASEKVPFLREALEVVLPYVRVAVEQKSGTAEQYVEEFRRTGRLSQILHHSFDLAYLRRVRQLEPNLELGLDCSTAVSAAGVREWQMAGISMIVLENSVATSAAIDMIHAAGLRVAVWTVNDVARMATVAAQGADALISDKADLARQFAEGRPEQTIEPKLVRSVIVSPGMTLALRLGIAPAVGTQYRWMLDGATLEGSGNEGSLVVFGFSGVSGSVSVTYESNGRLTGGASTAVHTQSGSGYIGNLSSLQYTGDAIGPEAVHCGFVATGDGPITLLLRGIGPSLQRFGVQDAAPSLGMNLYDARGLPIVPISGDSVGRAEVNAVARLVGAFPLEGAVGEVARLEQIASGPATAVLSTGEGMSGSSLFECYLATPVSSNGGLKNISTRATVRKGTGIVAGFVIMGNVSRTVFIRGIGPALSRFGIESPLRDPLVRLFAGDGRLLGWSDDWSHEISADIAHKMSTRVGAFLLRPDDRESMLAMTLEPGAYTCELTGTYDLAGIALLEVYDLDP